MLHRRRPRFAVGLGLLLFATAVVAISAGPATAWSSQAPNSSSALMDCGSGVPLVKCNESLYSPPPSLVMARATPATTWPSSEPAQMIPCAAGFFSEGTVSQLVQRFGTLLCFRMIGTREWIVVTDGLSPTSQQFELTPGGTVVAVQECAASDLACLDPASLHDFGNFTVFYPPAARNGRMELQSVEAGRFLMISDGRCGLFAFDIVTLKWYQNDQATRDSIQAGRSDVPSVQVPNSVPGSAALTQDAPASPAPGVCMAWQ